MTEDLSPRIECVAEVANACGESPVWDPRDRALYWVDIYNPALWRYSPLEGSADSRPLDRLVSAIGLRRSGGFVAATGEGLAGLDWPSGILRPLGQHAPDAPRHRFNDGKCDALGRFWIGTVDTKNYGATGELFRLDPDGLTHRVAEGFTTQNGLAFSPDRKTLYLSDSRRHLIHAFDLDVEAGAVANRRDFAVVAPPARPDGATVDADGNYWCALSRGWRIAAFSPDGGLASEIRMPVEHPLMCAFGDEGLTTLYVTSGTFALNDQGRKRQPLAGALFRITGLGARGLAEPMFDDASKPISWANRSAKI